MRILRVLALVVLVIGAFYVLYHMPGSYRKAGAESLVRFAQGGVTVRVTGTIDGTGSPISVPGGVGLLLAHKFRLTNGRGETKSIILCNGHPDHWRLLGASPSSQRPGGQVQLALSPQELRDEHMGMNHFSCMRHVRVQDVPKGGAR